MPTNVASSAASIAMSTNDTNDVITVNEESKQKMQMHAGVRSHSGSPPLPTNSE